MEKRLLAIHDVLRYARGADQQQVEIDGRINYHHVTSPAELGQARLMLERGINPSAHVTHLDETRRPVIAIRSSPWKAGHETNPWHDEFDMNHGHVRYYGDHKVTTPGLPGITGGNKALLEAWRTHNGVSVNERALAPPLLLWRSQTVHDQGRALTKGHVEFCGVGIIERLEYVVQRDPKSGASFPNIVLDIAVVEADEGDVIDMRWIDDRRDPGKSAMESLEHAPKSWRRWVKQGRLAVPRVRRRVLASRVMAAEDQTPQRGSDAAIVLDRIYEFFDQRKHAFEMLAAMVAGFVLADSGAHYQPAWLTRSGGDGGVDFVGRLDVGAAGASTPLVVLGQAKCVQPDTSTSADQVARVVARLKRGWVGVFVTTGVFSRQAQIEVIDDQYPLVLIPALKLVEVVVQIAARDFGNDLDRLLDSVLGEYEGAIVQRRPEEVLAILG